MISELAIDDIEDLEAKGLHPTPRDIVRLNALGLKIERSKSCGDVYAIPRVAFLGGLAFREPTVGHNEWISRFLASVSCKRYEDELAVTAYAISRSHTALPPVEDVKACVDAIGGFCREVIAPFTFDQVRVSVLYAMHGADAVACEYPPPTEGDGEAAADPCRAVGCGMVVETLALGLGVSVRDIAGMTLSSVRKLQNLALNYAGRIDRKAKVGEAQANYYMTLEEIRNRLEGERDGKGKH